MSKKALLMILDGWGIGDQGKDDVIFNTPDRKSTRLNSSHNVISRMPSSA